MRLARRLAGSHVSPAVAVWAIAIAALLWVPAFVAGLNDTALQSACGLTSQDFEDLRIIVDGLVQGGLGPKLLRLAHADAISYSIRSGRTGGMRGTLKLYSNSSLPPGLSAIMPFLEDYKILHPKASYADIWAYAASVAISESRGPAVPYRCGRKDLNATQFTPAPSLQPQGTWNASQIRARYSDMGLTDNETMAIFAMRGMGRMHPDVSGYDGRTTPFSLFITNAYFIQLTRMTTFVYSSSAKQWVNSASKTAMMPSDMSLMNDTSFQGAVQRYAANATLMFTDFVPAFVKLLELGTTSFYSEYIPTTSSNNSAGASTSTASLTDGSTTFRSLRYTGPRTVQLSWRIRDPYIDFQVSCTCLGWFAIGFGLNMADMDAIIMENGANASDRYASAYTLPYTDIARGGTDDVLNFTDITATSNVSSDGITWTRVVAFSRLLVTGDPYDRPIRRGEQTDLAVAFSDNPTLLWHGASGSVRLGSFDLFATSNRSDLINTSSTPPVRPLKYVHGASMVFSFVLCSFGVLAARYQGGTVSRRWLEWHQTLSTLYYGSMTLTFMSALGGQLASGALVEYKGGSFAVVWHPTLGITAYGICALTVFLGYMSASYFQLPFLREFFIRNQLNVRRTHSVLGYVVYFFSMVVATWGSYDLFLGDPMATTLFAAVIVAVPATLVVLGEKDKRKVYKEVQRRKSSVVMESKEGIAKEALYGTFKRQLPKMTWEDIEEAVLEGEQLIVIDNVIYHVEDFMQVHPGGTRGLKSFIGQDATAVFGGLEAFPSKQVEAGQSDLNLPSIIHAHSRVARYQLQSMEYGRLVERRSRSNSVASGDLLRRPSNIRIRNASIGPDRPSTLERSSGKSRPMSLTPDVKIFASSQLYEADHPPGKTDLAPVLEAKSNEKPSLPLPTTLISEDGFPVCEVSAKTVCNSPLSDRPIMHITMMLLSNESMCFRPGSYVMLQMKDPQTGKLARRPYTPIVIRADATIHLEFLIRVHARGYFSKLLQKSMNVGDWVSVKPVAPTVDERRTALVWNPRHPAGLYKSIVVLTKATALTSLLQLVRYYLAFAKDQSYKIVALNCQSTELDIFFEDILKGAVAESAGNFHLINWLQSAPSSSASESQLRDRGWSWGTVSEGLISSLIRAAGGAPDIFYVTGSPEYVGTVRGFLTKLHVDENKIIY